MRGENKTELGLPPPSNSEQTGTGLLVIRLGLVEGVGQTALTAILTVLVVGHEDTSTALLSRALTAQAGDLVIINLVVLEDGELDLLVLSGGLLGGGEVLLLLLLTTTTQAENEVESGLLLDVVIRKSAAVLELLASEDQTLLIRGDTLLVLDLLLNLVDSISGLNLESDGLASQRLNKDLHGCVG